MKHRRFKIILGQEQWRQRQDLFPHDHVCNESREGCSLIL